MDVKSIHPFFKARETMLSLFHYNSFKLARWPILLVLLAVPLAAQQLTNDLDRLLNTLLSSHARQSNPTVAVIPFSCTAADCDSLTGRTIAEYAVSFIATQGSYRVVERMDFQKVASELALFQTGVLSDELTLEAGKMLGAQIIVTGSIGEMMGRKMISARMIDTQSGEVLASSSVSVAAQSLQSFASELLAERTQLSATIFRSLLIPGWGQFYTNHPAAGTIFSLSALASTGIFVWSLVDWNNKSNRVAQHALKLYSTNPAEDAVLRSNAADAKVDAMRRTALLGGITGGVWAINIVNAALLGVREKGRVQELYFFATPSGGGAGMCLNF
jgi:TolB-like protein